MNIIFLDIDGVLNSECFYIKRYRNMRELRMIDVNSLGEKDPRVKRILCEIDLYNLDILKHIVNETNSKIVVISSVKSQPFFKDIANHLINIGLPIIDTTIDNGYNRGYGIKRYLETHNVNNYIVIDDTIFEDYDDEILNHLIKTNYCDSGLSPEDAEKSIKLLKK